jgi:uncharacterized metal-binding protein
MAVAAYTVTRNSSAMVTVAAAFIFGGIMFGPDLDTVSRQYTRWLFLRCLWLPYRWCFKHRSRFSHGLILGALLRVVYFMGVSTLLVYILAFVASSLNSTQPYELAYFTGVWRNIGEFVRERLGRDFLSLVFIGLWLGAASHTFTDMAGSFIKTGRIAKFL